LPAVVLMRRGGGRRFACSVDAAWCEGAKGGLIAERAGCQGAVRGGVWEAGGAW
jgi:hypothetical protein